MSRFTLGSLPQRTARDNSTCKSSFSSRLWTSWARSRPRKSGAGDHERRGRSVGSALRSPGAIVSALVNRRSTNDCRDSVSDRDPRGRRPVTGFTSGGKPRESAAPKGDARHPKHLRRLAEDRGLPSWIYAYRRYHCTRVYSHPRSPKAVRSTPDGHTTALPYNVRQVSGRHPCCHRESAAG